MRQLVPQFSRFLALPAIILLLGIARPALAVHSDTDSNGVLNCDIGEVNGDCTITTVHQPTADVNVTGNLTIETGGEIKFGDATRTLTVGGNLVVEAGGAISAQAGAGTTGGDLTINVAGDASVDGEITANGGPSGAPGNNGGSGGSITVYVTGDMSVGGKVTANGRDGSNGASSGPPGTNGGNGGAGGNGGSVVIAVGGNFSGSDVQAKAGDGGHGGAGQGINGGTAGNGGNGGNGGAGGNGGTVSIAACGNLDFTGDASAEGGDGGNGGNGGARSGNGNGNGGNGGNNASGGNGGSITMAADGSLTVSGNVFATGGDEGTPGAAGTRSGTGSGSAGAPGSDVASDGADGSITLSTAQGAVDTTGAIFDPAPTINVNQPSICAATGCSHGYWKNHAAAWALTGYSPTQTIGSVFANAGALAGFTLAEALDFGGGNTLDAAKQILLRQAVAALLNAAHPDIDYPRSVSEVIADVSAMLASTVRSDILALAAELDADNNLGCPLN
ncbi:MAG TPA: hypothetical protein VNL14_09305 [Candidatus Acidoferrales bacterium]|nr:hypothetical protein [Candidatus Acidoferrales bacterium]